MNSLKNWQVFLMIIFPLLVSGLFGDEFIKDIIKGGFFIVVAAYFLLIGDFLNQMNTGKNNWFFLINCFFMIIFYFYFILKIGLINEGLMIGLAIYFAFSYIYVADELAVGLRKAEGKEVSNFKQAPDFLLFFLWPIGIWILQPRINKLEE